MRDIVKKDKRDAVIYARVRPANKKLIADEAHKNEVSEAQYIDYMIDCHRDMRNDRKQRKSKRTNR